MNTFIRAFADYLTPFTASLVPEIFTPPGKPIDESRYGILILESASELIPGNRTMDLSLSLEIRFHLSEQGAFVAADTDAVETGLYNALSTALGELVQYMPLPGQPDTAPLLLNATITPPQSAAESYLHLIQFDISLIVQF